MALLDRPDTTLFRADVVSAAPDRLPALGYHLADRRDGIAVWRRGPQVP